MAVRGSAPSRRSHTKSRKGCKTCKRRHIRCDEAFPQCRNCTKHQVRCDYMEAPPATLSSGTTSPEATTAHSTPTSEATVLHWQQNSPFQYEDFAECPPQDSDMLSPAQLRFNQNLSAVSNSMSGMGVSELTLWTHVIPKYLSYISLILTPYLQRNRFYHLASASPFLMDALYSFSANHLAWKLQSAELRQQSMQFGGMALRGLHEAIGNFSRANADATLATSLIMSSQAVDW